MIIRWQVLKPLDLQLDACLKLVGAELEKKGVRAGHLTILRRDPVSSKYLHGVWAKRILVYVFPASRQKNYYRALSILASMLGRRPTRLLSTGFLESIQKRGVGEYALALEVPPGARKELAQAFARVKKSLGRCIRQYSGRLSRMTDLRGLKPRFKSHCSKQKAYMLFDDATRSLNSTQGVLQANKIPRDYWPVFLESLLTGAEKPARYLWLYAVSTLATDGQSIRYPLLTGVLYQTEDVQSLRAWKRVESEVKKFASDISFVTAVTHARQFFLREALRSAVVAIMARNLSHNIGSHILARLSLKDLVRTAAFDKNFLNSVQLVCEQLEQLEGDAFGQPSDIPLDVVERMRSLVKGIEPNIAPIVAEVANLNALLRTRMDFVADIATAHKPPPALGISFVSEVLIPLTKQVLFWDNLCASHGLNHEHIIFRFKVDNESDDITLEAGKVPELKGKSEPLTLATAGFPNGIIGCQAFYCIVENFLRNAVKHSPSQSMSQQSLELTLWLQQAGKWKENEHLMKLVIYDNWHACQHKKGLVNDINKRLKERVIRRDDGSLIASNRGLKEMKAAAAYLRGYSPEAVEDSTIKPPLLTAVNVEGSLGYELFVLRPKELLVAATADKIPRDKHDLLRKQGVEVVSDASTLLVKARDYPLLLVMSNDNDIRQALGDPSNVSDLPLRIIIHNGSEATAKSGLWQSTISYSVVEETFNKILESLRNGQGTEGIAHAWELWTTLAYKVCTPKLWVKEEGFTQWNINDISRLVQGDAEPDQGTQVVLYARHGYPDRLNTSVLFYEPYGKGVDPISFVMENPPNREDDLPPENGT
jgi:signal transduction histidine kinase